MLQRRCTARIQPLVLPALIAGALLLLPFFWLGGGASLGGDDTRLYFLYPWEWLRRMSLPTYNSLGGFGAYNPEIFSAAFTAVLAPLEFAFPWLNLEALAFGIAVSSGFVGVYATALQLLPQQPVGHRRVAAALGGMVYASSPLLAAMSWVAPLSTVIGIGGIPVLIALAIAYLRDGRAHRLFAMAILSTFYAIGVALLPISLPFLLGGAIAWLGWAGARRAQLCRRGLLLVAVTVGANAFWALPLVRSVLVPGSAGEASLALRTSAATLRGLAQGQSMLDTLRLLPPAEFLRLNGWQAAGIWGRPGVLAWPGFLLLAVIVGALLAVKAGDRAQRRHFVAVALATLILAYFQTVNVTSLGVQGFIGLSDRVPGFAMFRNFYDKFTAGFTFYYALALIMACHLVLSRMWPVWRWAAVGLLTAAVLVQGAPMLLGQVLTLPEPGATHNDRPYVQVGRLPPSLLAATHALSTIDPTARVLELPLSANYWSVFPLAEPNSLYVGSTPLGVLSGHDSFTSFESFTVSGLPQLRDRFQSAVTNRDTAKLGAVLRLSGTRYVLYTSGTPPEVLGRWFQKPAFPRDGNDMAALAQSLGASKIASFADADSTRTLYALPGPRSLPRLFVAGRVRLVDSGDELIDRAAGTDQGTGPSNAALPLSAIGGSPPAGSLLLVDSPDVGAVRRIVHEHPWQYALDVDARAPSLVVLLEPFTAGWTARGRLAEDQSQALAKLPVDGYASAWLLPAPGRYTVVVSYAPQGSTWLAMAITGLTLLLTAIGSAVWRVANRRLKHAGLRSAASPRSRTTSAV